MANRFEEIQKLLEELKNKYSDIEACMVVRKGLEGVIVFPSDFIEEVSSIWEPLRKTVDCILEMVSENAMYGIEKTYMEVLDYGIIFYVIGMSDTSLVTFIRKKDGVETMQKAVEKIADIKATRDRIQEIAEN